MRTMIATRHSRSVLLAVLLLLCGAGRGETANPLVYTVSGAGRPPSFLLGTMHSEDERVTGLLGRIVPLIGRVDRVAVELVPDAVSMLAISAATLLPPDQSLRELLGESRFEALLDATSRLGLAPAVVDRLKPWAVALTLGMPASETGRFLDMEIYLQALGLGRPVVGLESPAEQLAIFNDMAIETQLMLVDEMVKNAASMPKQLEELTLAYLQGDLGRLDQVARSQYADLPPAAAEWFERELLEKRNLRMLSRLGPLLEHDRILIAVGAMHLGGNSGLVAGLRRQGYQVERWRD